MTKPCIHIAGPPKFNVHPEMLPHLFAEDTCGVRQYKVLSLTPLALRDLKDDRVVTPKPVGSVAYRLFWRLPRHLRTLLDP